MVNLIEPFVHLLPSIFKFKVSVFLWIFPKDIYYRVFYMIFTIGFLYDIYHRVFHFPSSKVNFFGPLFLTFFG